MNALRLLALFLLVAVSAQAVTVVLGGVTVNYTDNQTGTISGTATWANTSGWAGEIWMTRLNSTETTDYGSQHTGTVANGTTGNLTFSFTGYAATNVIKVRVIGSQNGAVSPYYVYGSGNLSLPTGSAHVVVTIPANDTDHPKKYKLIDSNTGSQVGSIWTQYPGDGAIIQSFDVTGLTGPFLLAEMVDDYEQQDDGSWEFVPGAVTTTTIVDGLTSQTSSTSSQAAPSPAKTPTQKETPEDNKLVWHPKEAVLAPSGSVSDMSLAGFREGIDKLNNTLLGPPVSVVGFDSTSDVTSPASTSNVLGVLSKMPTTPPVMPTLGSDSSYTVTLPVPMLAGQTYEMKMDMTQMAPGIVVYKNIVRFFMAVAFFLAVLKMFKEGFA